MRRTRPLRLTSALALLALGGGALPCAHLRAEPPSSGYELLFEENFDGNSYDASRWRPRIDHRVNSYLDGHNRAANVSVSDGCLRIAVRTETEEGKTIYTGGGLISRHQFGYGYYEARSRPFMAGRGVHSAFWQAGGNQPNNRIFEIDSHEIDSTHRSGDNNLYIHLGTREQPWVPWPLRANVPLTFQDDGWFVDAYEYTPEGVVFYDNGKRVASIHWPRLTAAQVVWLTALNGAGAVDAAMQPGETLFDYFRYYARDYPGENLLPNGGFEYNQDLVLPTTPVAWQPQASPEGALRVTKGEAARDDYKLVIGSKDTAHRTSLAQALEFLRNGTYELSARVRTSGGQSRAAIDVDGLGGPPRTLELPSRPTAGWTRIELHDIEVAAHGVRLTVRVDGEAGQWLELDDIRFQKPAAAALPRPAEVPFVLMRDPIWSACFEETAYTDGRRFNFIDRNVGFGDAITVSLVMTPEDLRDCSPIARIPKTGVSGWALLLSRNGDLVFRIGSAENHADLVARRAYVSGRAQLVTAVLNHGEAELYVDGQRVAVGPVSGYDTRDRTQAGKLGAVGGTGEAIGDVTVRDKRAGPLNTSTNYKGQLQDVRVYNRALSPAEVAGLPTPGR